MTGSQMTGSQMTGSGWPGVKYFEFLRAPAGSSDPGVHRRWGEERAEWLAKRPEVARHLRRHELYERLPADEGRKRAAVEVADAGYDAVSVQWFDGVDDYYAMGAAAGADELRELDAKYRHPATAAVLTAPPDIIVGPPGGEPGSGMSLICILAHLPGMDLSKFHEHWLHRHGLLFQTIPELRDPLLGYEQNHGVGLGVGSGEAEFDGVTQQWFESLDAWMVSLEAPANADVVAPDMARFLDPKRIFFVLAGPPSLIAS